MVHLKDALDGFTKRPNDLSKMREAHALEISAILAQVLLLHEADFSSVLPAYDRQTSSIYLLHFLLITPCAGRDSYPPITHATHEICAEVFYNLSPDLIGLPST
jgi:hypothetical protein